MATLEQIIQFSLAVLGENTRKIGEKTSPTDLTVNGQVFDTGNVTVADNFGTATLWQANQGGMASFSYLILLTNADIYVELANTVPATDERLLFKVPANTICVLPSSVMGGFASNTSRLDGAVLVSATDYNLITDVKVQRDVADAVGDATVRLVLIN